MKKYTYSLIALLAAGPVFSAFAQGPAACGNCGDKKAEMIKLFDADGDGQLSAEELKTARMAFHEMLGPKGAHQGMAGEQRGERRGPPNPKMFQDGLMKFDADGNGQLSAAELDTAFASFREKRGAKECPPEMEARPRDGRHMNPKNLQGVLKKFDVNGDGQLSAEELAEVGKQYQAE